MARSALAAVMVAGSLVAASAADTIVVEGNSRVDADTIRSYFNGSDANEAVKKLYETGFFSDVKVSRSGSSVVVHVVENTKSINHVVFVGNSKVKSEDLEKEVRSRNHGAYSQIIVDSDVQRIMDIYRRSGRSTATVKSRIVEAPNGKIDVVFDISEGDKTGVREIRFVGNNAYSSSKLLGMIETTEMNYLSFVKSSDVYEPDRLAKDAEQIRRYYLKNGYADVRMTGVDAVYDAAKIGYVVTFTIEEGAPYHVGSINFESHVRGLSDEALRRLVRVESGDLYNGDLVEKTNVRLTKEMGRLGYAFAQVRPRGDRDPATHTVNLSFVIEEGPRAYIERINIKGNNATRDYVIRREFDISEGDAYNKTLLDRTERRLNGLGFFKKVKITNEQGSSPDRVIVNVEVEEQSTGSFSVSGGYSTVQGWLAEVSVSQSNFLGRGEYVRTSVSYGQYSKGIEFNFTEPFFLDNRMAAGFDAYTKLSSASPWAYYSNWVSGGTLRLGIPLTEEITFAPRYTGYVSTLSVPNNASQPFNDCQQKNWIPGVTPVPAGQNVGVYATNPIASSTNNCLTNGEASVALKQAQGTWVTSMVGYTAMFNNLDNMRDPHLGLRMDFKQDLAGVGGDSKFIRTTADVRAFHELYFDDIVGVAHFQGGNLTALGGGQLRVIDNFNLGQTLVRGFAPGGIGPRDMTNTIPGSNIGNALGGTDYFGASLEAQFPIWGLPRDVGLKGAIFADAGTLFNYTGSKDFSSYLGYGSSQCVAGGGNTAAQNIAKNQATAAANYTQAACINVGGDSIALRSSVGASLIWASPMGPIRFNYAIVTSKQNADVTQNFSFSGGTSF